MSKPISNKKKQLIGIAVILIVIIVFSVFVYIPKHKDVARLKTQINEIEEQITLTNAMLGDMKKLGHLLGQMQQEMKFFEKRLPTQKQISSIVSELSSLAPVSFLEVISIKPEKPVQMIDKDGKGVNMGQDPLDSMKIHLELRASYKALAEYIRKIQDSLNILASIDDIKISGNDDMASKLDVDMTLTIFVIGER